MDASAYEHAGAPTNMRTLARAHTGAHEHPGICVIASILTSTHEPAQARANAQESHEFQWFGAPHVPPGQARVGSAVSNTFSFGHALFHGRDKAMVGV